MILKSNFVGDWTSILRNILENHWGYDTEGVTDKDLPCIYFNAEKRRPDQRPRKIILSDTFKCPENLQTGWDHLQVLIKTGQNITPNLSKKVKDLYEKDPILNDWGVHHFHLGNNIKGEFIERTRLLLFSLITNENFYAIGIYEHGSWCDVEIVEIIHRNWPEEIAKNRITGINSAPEITQQQRRNLRDKNANSFVTMSDGTTYAPIGGGVNGAGYNCQSTIMIHRQKKNLRNLEKNLQSKLINFRDDFVKNGYSGEPEVEAKLEITENNEYIAFFPKFNMRVNQ